jgi:hypothetical protein
MTLHEMMPALHALPRYEKLRVIQLMAADIACEDAGALMERDHAHAVWSPHDAFDGAQALLRALDAEKAV